MKVGWGFVHREKASHNEKEINGEKGTTIYWKCCWTNKLLDAWWINVLKDA